MKITKKAINKALDRRDEIMAYFEPLDYFGLPPYHMRVFRAAYIVVEEEARDVCFCTLGITDEAPPFVLHPAEGDRVFDVSDIIQEWINSDTEYDRKKVVSLIQERVEEKWDNWDKDIDPKAGIITEPWYKLKPTKNIDLYYKLNPHRKKYDKDEI